MDNLVLIVLVSVLPGCAYAEAQYCVTARHYHGWYYTYEYEYCDQGCCDEYPNHTCCEDAAWVIAVGVIGSIIFLACIVACICCIVKKKNQNGVVIMPQQHSTNIAMVTHQNAGYQQPYMQQQYQQPGFQQSVYPPPPPNYMPPPQ